MGTRSPSTCRALRGAHLRGDPTARELAVRQNCAWVEQPCTTGPARSFVANGRQVTIRPTKGDCAPTARGPSPAQLAWREAMSEALRNARSPKPPCDPTAPPGLPPFCATGDRSATTVITPQGRDDARYAVFPAAELIASHEPGSFTPDPRYPGQVQEREYQFDKNEQVKVIRGSETLDPAVLLHRSPTAVDGPPLVTEDGCALGGNGRTLMLKRAYASVPAKAEAYREALACAARDFGLDPREVTTTPDPILVRVIRGTRCDDDPRELAQAVRRYNEGLTQSLDVKALGVSQSRQVSEGTIGLFGELLRGDTSLREALAENARPVIDALTRDGIITQQNRGRWVRDNGALTDEAKGQIEAMFLGRALGTSERVRLAPDAVLRKVERAVPYLAAVAGRNPTFDLTPAIQEAVDLATRADASKQSIDQIAEQFDAFTKPPSPQAVALARMLLNLNPTTIRDRFKAWAGAAAFDPSQGMLGSRPPTMAEAFQTLTTAPRVGRALFSGSVVKQPGGALARIVEMPGPGSKLKDGKARVEWITGPEKGTRAVLEQAELGDLAR